MKQGGYANRTGTTLEKFIQAHLDERGYKFIDKKKFKPTVYLEQPIYTRQFHVGSSIYETPFYCDFILYHPEKWPDCLVVESKWQQSSGSVDEKYPYTILNIKMCSPYPSILLLDGGGYKAGAERWLRNQVNGKLLHVFNMREFQTWVNKGGI